MAALNIQYPKANSLFLKQIQTAAFVRSGVKVSGSRGNALMSDFFLEKDKYLE
jgi:hypothetical protein